MEQNLIKKESTLTTINEKYLHKLSDIQIYIMNDIVEDALLSGETETSIDLDIGVLTIRFEDNDLRFRFKPSAKFEESLISTIQNKQNPLTLTLERTLVNKLLSIYKELI